MPLRRFGRPGLLGSIGRDGIIAGTAAMTSRALQQHLEQPAAVQQTYVDRREDTDVQSAASAPDLVSQLSELAQLRSSGAMTEEEFRSAKARLLTR